MESQQVILERARELIRETYPELNVNDVDLLAWKLVSDLTARVAQLKQQRT